MSATCQNNFVDFMKSHPFRIASEGSNDLNQLKQFPLVIRIFSIVTGYNINFELLAMNICEDLVTIL
jgi:hypothetical protein